MRGKFAGAGAGRARYGLAMPNYRRAWVPGGTYFFTVNLLERRRILLVEYVDALRAAFRAVQAARAFEMIAVVVLPTPPF